jgi:hypothetical protein
MASMGLKVNHDQYGTETGGLLAKALLPPDAADAIATERMKSALMTDALQRKLLREQTTLATQQAIDRHMLNQREHAAWLARYGAIDDASQLETDMRGAPVVEPPVVADPVVTAATGSTEPDFEYPVTQYPTTHPGAGPEPDFEYRVNQYPLRSDAEPPVPIDLPAYSTVRPEGPLGALPGAPPSAVAPGLQVISSFNARPAGPLLSMPEATPGVGIHEALMGQAPPEEPIGITPRNHPVIDWLTGADPTSDFLARPGGPPPQAQPAAPEQPIPVDPLAIYNTVRPEGPLGSLPAAEYVDTVRPEGPLGSLPAAEPPLPVESLVRPALGEDVLTEANLVRPEGPLGALPAAPPPPAEVITVPGRETPIEARPAEVITVPGRDIPPAAVAAATPAEGTSAAAAEAPAPATPASTASPTSAVVGVDGGAQDTATTIQTTQGPVEREKVSAMMKYIFLNAATPGDGVQAAQRWAGTIGATYNPKFGTDANFTENAASLRQGGAALGRESVLGSDAAIRVANETESAKPKYQMIDDRLYRVGTGANGEDTATLVGGQPDAKEVNPYGDSLEGNLMWSVSKLNVAKPDPKTWTPEEKLNYSQMIEHLYGSKVEVAADGTIVDVGGKLPDGVLPGSAGFKSGTLPPSTVAPAPDAAPAAPDAAAPATAPATAPAPAAPAGRGKKNKHGRFLTEEGYPSYGGYLAGDQPAPPPIEQELGGRKVTTARPAERTKEAEGQTGKQVTYTRQALEPAAYFLKLKKGDVKVTALQDIMAKMAEDTPVEKFLQRYTLSADEREYFRNVIEIVKDMSHKDSGADVTKSDLVTYSSLYELPLDPTEKDLALMKRSIRGTLRGSREGFVGAVPAEALRAWDKEAGRLGIDLDEEEYVAPIGASDGPSEEDIQATMKARNMTRQQVLDALDAKKKRGAQ